MLVVSLSPENRASCSCFGRIAKLLRNDIADDLGPGSRPSIASLMPYVSEACDIFAERNPGARVASADRITRLARALYESR